MMAPISLLNSAQWSLTGSLTKTSYLVQVAWPLNLNPADAHSIIYVLDGNAYFNSVLETVRRSRYPPGDKTIVVGVGYEGSCGTPDFPNLFDGTKRSRDLTIGKDHVSYTHPFLDFILETLIPSVNSFLVNNVKLKGEPKYKTIMGHSFGGLFTLTSLLLTVNPKYQYFDSYAAFSPSIWFADRLILKYAEKYIEEFSAANTVSASKPKLLIAYGTQEQYPAKFGFEPEEQFQKRRKMSLHNRMYDNVLEFEALLSPLVDVEVTALSNANHGVVGSAMSAYGVPWILEKFVLHK
jgi:predicted alpha/beta superfamily hydrolase